jgi:DNA-binding beta-propeller fold protein YncE
MDQLEQVEQKVRVELARAVETTPMLLGLTDRVIRGGRRRRRLRTAAASGAVLAVVALAGVQWAPALGERIRTSPAARPGPPQVPLVILQGDAGEILDWSGGVQRSRALGEALPVAVVPSGLLLMTGGSTSEISILPNDSTTPVVLLRGLTASSVAVSDDGARMSVVTGAGIQRRLRELELPSGRELRSVSVGPPLVAVGEPLLPVAYSNGAVLLTLGEGDTRRTALWESGDDEVIGALDGFTGVLGGAPVGRSAAGSPGGRAAFTVAAGKCAEAVADLRNGDSSWPLCNEHFAGFSPDGKAVLAANAADDALIVHSADDGDTRRTLPVPSGLRAYGWESDDAVLYTTVKANVTVVIRCAVDSGRCRTAATFAGVDRIPQPVRRFGD